MCTVWSYREGEGLLCFVSQGWLEMATPYSKETEYGASLLALYSRMGREKAAYDAQVSLYHKSFARRDMKVTMP